MDSEILKFICDNQGAVDTNYLMFNLGSGEAINDVISNQDTFAMCCPFGQPKVVARTNLKMCKVRDCEGFCNGLHLCKSFLFSGSCPLNHGRMGSRFSHQLDSDHNMLLLSSHDLESLNLTQLRTLLLQSDNWLLPPICHNYNNGGGPFGLCGDGLDCKRMHICERYLNRDCSCAKNHDFDAPQPHKSLQERSIPDNLIPSLRSIYGNILAMKYNGRRGDRGNSSTVNDGSDDNGENSEQRQAYRGRGGHRGNSGNRGNRGNSGNRGDRGNRGGRGNRGNRGNRGQRGCSGNRGNSLLTSSPDDIVSDLDFDVLDLYSEDGWNEFQQPLAFFGSDISEDAPNRKQNPNNTWTTARGRGGPPGSQSGPTANIPGAAKDDAKGGSGPGGLQRPRPVRDKTEICLYFVKGRCIHDDERCFKVHVKMPYKWEVREDNRWTALPDNEAIEKDYCNPEKTYSAGITLVHFDTMTRGLDKVRRLSTANSLLEPTFRLTTEWVWYWEDEFGKWNIYASAAAGRSVADMDSSTLERRFLSNDKDVVNFAAGSQSYSLSFEDMMQINTEYNTKRLVRRRPKFVSAADVQTQRVRRPAVQLTFNNIPNNWDKAQIPETGYKRVPLLRLSDDFKELESLFRKTMRGFDIVKIERIQNKSLLDVFHWQNNQMKNNNNGRNVTEKLLFHGTDPKYVDVICHTNFDRRICGLNGTVFGQGSYFARDAKYSHSYTGESDVRSMFVSRVLVGDYTEGKSSYRRPPSKDGGDINFYHSCVDDVLNPSVFVVFEKHQIYPEYLLQYRATPPSAASYRPSASATPPSAASYRPSASATPPSAASHRPSASATPPSAASYRPSASATPPSAASHRPSASATSSTTYSNNFNTAYSTGSFVPKSPPPPKNDSCVIV
ncbi:protein mono-ADP-ribosyltransferase PARP12 [Spinachia spinachia]